MNIKTIFASTFLSFISLLLSNGLAAQVSFGKAEKINNAWKFLLKDERRAHEKDYNDKNWQQIELPHDWSIKAQLSPKHASCTGYLPGGVGWYRKSINIPHERRHEKTYLYFEGIYNRSEVYINGHLLGSRPNGYVSFMYDITHFVRYGQKNVVSVRVDHSQSADSRWYSGSGIYRNAWLIYAHPIHIAPWGVYAYTKTVHKKQAVLGLEVEIENGTESPASILIKNELIAPDGKTVARNSKRISVEAQKNSKISVEMKVSDAQLWSLETPNLYRLKTTLFQDEKTIDSNILRTGFRTFTFDPEKGFALNGRSIKMKGVCLHHDAGVLGSAVPRKVWERRLTTLKKIGVNAIRTSHNPQAPDLYELCDTLGLLVLNEAYDEWEFPKRKWIEGWNIGTPGFQGSYDFFKTWGEKDLADMVRRDRNHPSIFAWSIGNEVDYPNDPYSHPILGSKHGNGFTQAIYGGYNPQAPDAMRLGEIAQRLAAIVRTYDSHRAVTAGLAGVAMSNETEYPNALDIAGYNYTENRYITDHQNYPRRVIYGSENRHDMEAWKAVRDNRHIFGQFLWTGIDYLGESGPWPSRGFYSGLLDFAGFIKPRGYFRKALWTDEPMAYLGTYPIAGKDGGNSPKDVLTQFEDKKEIGSSEEKIPSMDAWPIWNYQKGQPIRIVCYTNTAKAKLLLNGKQAGPTKDYNDDTGIIYWDLPYEAGRLEVVGMDDNENETVRHTIQSSRSPHALSIVTSEKAISKNDGIAHVVVQVTDKDGIPVMLSDHEITCQITGPAQLLGLEAGNNEDMSDYTDNRHRAFHGRLLAYIRATGEPGQINVAFHAQWLKSASINIQAK